MSSESDFIQPNKKNGLVVVKINVKVFPIDLIYSAAYSIMDRAYVILDGSPEDTIYAILKPRTFKGELAELGRIFYDDLVASAFQTVQLVRNRDLRNALLQSLVPAGTPVQEEQFKEELVDEKDIAALWEDKFGEKIEGNPKKGK
ncbi:MAG: hypothetical protein GOU99_01795 [Candidatus Altiarchaeota archaeon]|nr:hypothetical protein [Candidatus Altiarchaeota archaeon]